MNYIKLFENFDIKENVSPTEKIKIEAKIELLKFLNATYDYSPTIKQYHEAYIRELEGKLSDKNKSYPQPEGSNRSFYKNKKTGQIVKLDREDESDGWNYWEIKPTESGIGFDYVGTSPLHTRSEVENNPEWEKIELK